jgi:AmpD protein
VPVVLLSRESPNYSDRPAGTVINTIVLHADSAPKVAGSIEWLRDPASRVSYHVLLGRLGDCYQFVPFDKKAWHAGKSVFEGEDDVNRFSIGVSFGNRNDGKEPYTEAQYQKGAELIRELMVLFPSITKDRITTHAIISPGRKTDPGPKFDLPYFLGLI